jgi:DNA-binding CsgD family transcriptional regulator
VYTKFLIRDATQEQFAWLNDLERVSSTPENALELRRTFAGEDLRELAKMIKVPTLVLHSKNDLMIPFEKGRQIAAHIPGARFVAFDGENHVLLSPEPTASQFWDEFYRFLGINAETLSQLKEADSAAEQILWELSARKRDVLRLVAKGYDNMQIARRLSLSEKTVRNYVSIIYAKLQIHSRGEAIVIARRSGLLDDKSKSL